MAFVLKFDILYEATWIDILAFGIGFGAFEAWALGFGALGQVGQYIFRPESIPQKYREEEDLKITVGNLSMSLVGPAERASTICIHVFSNVLIILAVQQNIYLLFWLSFGFKTLVDGIAGWMTLEKDIENSTKVSQWWAYQSVFMILALISIVGIVFLQKIWYSQGNGLRATSSKRAYGSLALTSICLWHFANIQNDRRNGHRGAQRMKK